MVKTGKIKGLIIEKGLTQADVAKALGIAPNTFYQKMKRGVFGSDEIETMIDLLNIEDPVSIFFARV